MFTGATSTESLPTKLWAPDRGGVLADPVVVGEDRARADVGCPRRCRVAAVGEVRHLRALADDRVLRLHEGPDLAPRPRAPCPGAGTRTARPWRRPADHGELAVGADDASRPRRPRRRSAWCPGRWWPLGHRRWRLRGSCRAAGSRPRRGRRRRAIQVVAGSITVTPSAIQRAQDPPVQLGAALGELGAVVDALGLQVVGRAGAPRPGARPPGRDRPRRSGTTRPGRSVACNRARPALEHVGVEHVDARVDLADVELGVGGVPLLDDPRPPRRPRGRCVRSRWGRARPRSGWSRRTALVVGLDQVRRVSPASSGTSP